MKIAPWNRCLPARGLPSSSAATWGSIRSPAFGEKKMFGSICFLLHGNLLVGVWKDSLIARLGPDEGEEALREPHVRVFDVTGRAMKNWVLVEPDGIDDDAQLKDWIDRAMKFVQRLPKKV